MTNPLDSILPSELAHLDGSEEILTGTTVKDFWAWALGDLRLNSTRGLLAQFLVARAVGDTRRFDDGWGAYDVESTSGAKIEVKTSAYLQSWNQKRLSNILFSGLITHRWSATAGYTPGPTVAADAYVFCVQTCTVPSEYDPLDLDQWDFYVLSGKTIEESNQKTMGLRTVQRLSGGTISWHQLASSIEDIVSTN